MPTIPFAGHLPGDQHRQGRQPAAARPQKASQCSGHQRLVAGMSVAAPSFIITRRNTMKRYLALVIVAISGLLSGCATTFDSEVTAFHAWRRPAGQDLRIRSGQKSGKQPGIQ